MDNANSPEYLEKIRSQVIENLKRTAFAPSVQMTDVPRNSLGPGMDDDADDAMDDLDADHNPDVRYSQRDWDKYISKDGELSESEDEEANSNMGIRHQPGQPRRRNIMDYQNPNAAPDDFDSHLGTPDVARSINGETSARGTKDPSPALGRRSASRASSARPQPSGTNGTGNAAGARSNGTSSRTRTPAVAADDDGDVDMDEPSGLDRSYSPSGNSQNSAAQDTDAAAPGPSTTTTHSQTARVASRSRSPGFVVTPPESPAAQPAAAAPAATATGEDVEMAEDEAEAGPADQATEVATKEEGVEEQQEEYIKAEAATEAATKAE